MFHDASLSACSLFVQGSSLVSHRNWSTVESQKTSTWRELAAIKFALAAFEAHLSGLRICCNTDNQNVVRIIKFGSMVKELQDIALEIFLFTSRRQIQLAMNWIPCDQNSQANFFSKIVDFDSFFHLKELCGPHSVNRFACSYTAKLPRFNKVGGIPYGSQGAPLPSQASFPPHFTKNYGRGFSLGTTHVRKLRLGVRKGHAPRKNHVLQ